MSTLNFRTRTEMIKKDNGTMNDTWVIGMDVGYSSVKSFSPNSISCFPYYAKKLGKECNLVGTLDDTVILYKDLDTNEYWLVGKNAQDMISVSDTSDSESTLYGRERYYHPMFLVCARAGIALGMQTNDFGSPIGKKIVLQTGLPEKYLKMDTNLVIDALSGRHNFALKIGNEEWKRYDFNLDSSSIFVMSQPLGTFISASYNTNGKEASGAEKYPKEGVIIFDAGFGTLDTYPVIGGIVRKGETFPDLGMRRILEETSSMIFEKYHIEVPTHAMQRYLETGCVTIFDRKNYKTTEVSFEQILDEATKKVCYEAIDRIMQAYDNLWEYKYLIITGGTGDAWNSLIRQRLETMNQIVILDGNQNDGYPCIYSNARGYYILRKKLLMAAKRTE